MIKKKYFFILLCCLFFTSAYGEELTDYTWQQESASCIVNINCILNDNDTREKRKKCLQLSEHDEEKNKLKVIGASCSATTKDTEDDTSNTLSAVLTSVKKSFTEIDPDFSLSESVDIILLYVQTNKKSIENISEQQQVNTAPVILIRLKSDVFFDFNSKKINTSGSTIIHHLVSDVLAASPRYNKISVVGHTDNVGTAEDNLRLSKARSDIAVAELQKQLRRLGNAANISNSFQIESVGVGESQPIEHTERELASQANRRLEIFLSPSSIALHKTEKYIQCLHRWDDAPSESDLADCFLEYMVIQE
uniref:OmpA family protein n=1 Tax=Candidatus Electrothrix sp. TaxID=2170559 RepID=UPI004055C714